MSRAWCCVFLAGLVAVPAAAADLDKLDRTIRKEPAYRGKPGYALLAFGPDAARVWLVRDGDALYVDRNGDGDLTGPGERVAAKVSQAFPAAEYGYSFEAGDLAVGGKVHKGLDVSVTPLKRYAENPSLANVPAIRDAYKADPAAMAVRLSLDVESARLKGDGFGGRAVRQAGFYDLTGVLRFADTPAAAPVVHFDGPLQVTFYGDRPTLRLGREEDTVLMVGTPGRGPGTFAMLNYQDTMPEKLSPVVEVTYPPAEPGDSPVRARYELKQRC